MLIPASHRRAFFSVVAAQFLSSLADNALLIAAIALLLEHDSAAWTVPALRICFYLSYVLLAAFAGAAADALPKGRVIALTGLVKLAGCGLLLGGMHPLLAYALVGFGASAYSPAKYGILPELLPASELVMANAWIEGSTVLAILMGVVLGSALMEPNGFALPMPTPALSAIASILLVYAAASLAALSIPRGRASAPAALSTSAGLLSEFRASAACLWRDPAAGMSLAVTSLFWAVAAALQFVVLRWAAQRLALPLSRAALLQASLALGVVAGALAAARWVSLKRGLKVLPLGLAIGALVMAIMLVATPWQAGALFAAIGALSGIMLVPMNALLQARGRLLMHAGQSIAVQNFFENVAALVALSAYSVLVYARTPLGVTILGFGCLIVAATLTLMVRQASVNIS